MTKNHELDIKQFLFDSCPDDLKKTLIEYISGLKNTTEYPTDALEVKMNIIYGRMSNPKLPLRAASHFLTHLQKQEEH